MAKRLYITKDVQGTIYAYSFHCPGCKCGHSFFVAQPKNKDGTIVDCKYPIWQFNGDLENPTFSPSLLYRSKLYPSGKAFPTDEEEKRMQAGEILQMKSHVCHTFVRNGQIQFLGDCTHEFANKTVELPEI